MISRALDSIANIEFKQYNLNKGQYLYLVRVFENPGIIQERLAEMIKVDRTTAARSIKKLVDSDILTRKKDANNKKNWHLYVTDKGKKIAPIILKENQYSNQQALKGISDSDAKKLSELLHQVNANIDDDWHYVKKGNSRIY
ncbi:MarR family winged helix-turn-helix transcriptional regulator [Lentilactobacillus sp. SPB1-3]|uniref:MarR family winged helix-turn-helix transcriptional regulator n=1 Tax=Lentilactobacillus terminaliae TaxID=3003483 RepID=A0ACD5DFU4_9LACO|nr:MarR family transcriptional regulator [Lentilactobacillus sp. SPB1-3]MCZ0976340.1 MarR family transcriptional regulator [Lentilactobacillus sp. SPB1-3]